MSLDWSIFCRSTTGNVQLAGCLGQNGELSYLQWLLSAWGWTATVALLGFVIALIIGIVVGSLRSLQARPWLSGMAAAWVELFRDIPLLVQVFLWYHVAPFFLPALKTLPSWLLVSIALGLFTSARIAEQVMAGFLPHELQQRHPSGFELELHDCTSETHACALAAAHASASQAAAGLMALQRRVLQ